MTIKASKTGHTGIALTIAIILLATIAFVETGYPSQSKIKINTETTINQIAKQSPLPASVTDINETNRLDKTYYSINYSSAPLNQTSTPSKTDTNKQPFINPLFFSLADSTIQDQTPGLDAAPLSTAHGLDADNSYNNFSESPTAPPVSTQLFQFNTYTYGGYLVQQPDPTQFCFSFPDSTNQGQIAGSDALTLNSYTIQKISFDAMFVTPKINALGFDEMVIFAASDTTTYKGTEVGIRMDLKDGLIYGYNQEPGSREPFSYFSEVNFRMLGLMPNDGNMHHYTMIMLGTEVAFYVDGVNYGTLSFLSNTDYSSLTFSVLAVVHRFTDDWDAVGDNMTAENFSLN